MVGRSRHEIWMSLQNFKNLKLREDSFPALFASQWRVTWVMCAIWRGSWWLLSVDTVTVAAPSSWCTPAPAQTLIACADFMTISRHKAVDKLLKCKTNKIGSTAGWLRVFLRWDAICYAPSEWIRDWPMASALQAHSVGRYMRCPPEEPHLAWGGVTFFGDFRHLSWAYFMCKWAKILICWCQSLGE